MTKEEFIEEMKNAKDGYDYYTNTDNMNKLDIFDLEVLIDIGEKYLNDQEKAKFSLLRPLIFDSKNKNIDNLVYKKIYQSIISNDIKNEVIFNPEFIDQFNSYDLIQLMSKNSINILLKNHDKRELFKGFSSYDYRSLLDKLNDDEKIHFLKDTENFKDIGFSDYDISSIIETIRSEESIDEILNSSLVNNKNIGNVLKGLDDKFKIRLLEKNDSRIDKNSFLELMASFKDIENIINTCNSYPDFFEKYDCELRSICNLIFDQKKQIEFLNNIDGFNRSDNEKRRAFVNLRKDIRESIDRNNLNPDYIKILDMEYDDDNFFGPKLIFNPEINVEEYRGFDDLFRINPKNFSKSDVEKLYKLFEVCPNVKVYSDMFGGQSIEEYKRGEEWVKSVIDKIDSTMSDVQKIYIIDEAIGKKISYSPTHTKENQDLESVRKLWRIINTGYGVCNGISEIENYMLNKIGIDSEIISSESGTHSFLKIKNLNIDGKNVGDSILDPTWNLTDNRVSDRPNWFLTSYENAKIMNPSGAHKNDKKLEDANYNLDKVTMEKELKGIGKVNEYGKFPFEEKMEKLEKFCDKYNDIDLVLLNGLKFIQDNVPDFVNCQNSTKKILQQVLTKLTNRKSQEFKIREGSKIADIYRKNDEKKEVVTLIQIVKENGEQFLAYADKETNSFRVTNEKFLEKFFSSYDVDKEKHNGREIWDLTPELDKANKEYNSENKKDKDNMDRDD